MSALGENVYVLQVGAYTDEYIEGVYATLAAAKKASGAREWNRYGTTEHHPWFAVGYAATILRKRVR